MTADDLTLRHFFLAEAQQPLLADHEGFAAVAQVTALKEKILAAARSLPWSAVAGEIGKHIGPLLHIPLKDILRGGWERAGEIRKVLEKGEASPEESFLVPLAKHTITSEHRPASTSSSVISPWAASPSR